MASGSGGFRHPLSDIPSYDSSLMSAIHMSEGKDPLSLEEHMVNTEGVPPPEVPVLDVARNRLEKGLDTSRRFVCNPCRVNTLPIVSKLVAESGRATLIVCQPPILDSWIRSLEKAGVNPVVRYHGSRGRKTETIAEAAAVVTTYNVVQSELRKGPTAVLTTHWPRVVLDDCEAMRRPSARRTVGLLRSVVGAEVFQRAPTHRIHSGRAERRAVFGRKKKGAVSRPTGSVPVVSAGARRLHYFCDEDERVHEQGETPSIPGPVPPGRVGHEDLLCSPAGFGLHTEEPR